MNKDRIIFFTLIFLSVLSANFFIAIAGIHYQTINHHEQHHDFSGSWGGWDQRVFYRNDYTHADGEIRIFGHRHGSGHIWATGCLRGFDGVGPCVSYFCNNYECGHEYGGTHPHDIKVVQGVLNVRPAPMNYVWRSDIDVSDAEAWVVGNPGRAYFDDAPVSQCSDGADNDDDTLIDFGSDPGCDDANDDSEDNPPANPPPGPLTLSAYCTGGDTSHVHLDWTSSANTGEYKVERRIWSTGTWYELGMEGAGVTDSLDNDPEVDADNYYRVIAINSIDDTYSNVEKVDVSSSGCGAQPPPPTNNCGNGGINPPEQCDGGDLGGQTCLSLGYAGGSLACTSSCTYTGCTGAPPPPPPSSDVGSYVSTVIKDSSGGVIYTHNRGEVAIPLTLPGNTLYKASITMRNGGTTTWSVGQEYRLGSQDPQDTYKWGISRVDVPGSIAPTQTATFDFDFITPPATHPHCSAGVCMFRWRMVKESPPSGWFDEYTEQIPITISSCPVNQVCVDVPGNCADAPGAEVNISWNASPLSGVNTQYTGTPVYFFVDVSTTANLNNGTWWNKPILVSTDRTTTALTGFSCTGDNWCVGSPSFPIIVPDTPYFTRVLANNPATHIPNEPTPGQNFLVPFCAAAGLPNFTNKTDISGRTADDCSDEPYTATINWSGIPNKSSKYDFFVDIRPDTDSFTEPNFYNRTICANGGPNVVDCTSGGEFIGGSPVAGSFSIGGAPAGFGIYPPGDASGAQLGNTFDPGRNYYVRIACGGNCHGLTGMLNVPFCLRQNNVWADINDILLQSDSFLDTAINANFTTNIDTGTSPVTYELFCDNGTASVSYAPTSEKTFRSATPCQYNPPNSALLTTYHPRVKATSKGRSVTGTTTITVRRVIPPVISDVRVLTNTQLLCTSGNNATVTWTYTDLNLPPLPQDIYTVEIDDNPAFDNPEWSFGTSSAATSVSTGLCNSTIPEYTPQYLCQIDFGRNYYVRVRARNTNPSATWSDWSYLGDQAGSGEYRNGVCIDAGGRNTCTTAFFETPPHRFPIASFSFDPLNPGIGSPMTFTDDTDFEIGALQKGWGWFLQDGRYGANYQGAGSPSPYIDDLDNVLNLPLFWLTSLGEKNIRLYVKDNATRFYYSDPAYDTSTACYIDRKANIQRAVPKWREILPR